MLIRLVDMGFSRMFLYPHCRYKGPTGESCVRLVDMGFSEIFSDPHKRYPEPTGGSHVNQIVSEAHNNYTKCSLFKYFYESYYLCYLYVVDLTAFVVVYIYFHICIKVQAFCPGHIPQLTRMYVRDGEYFLFVSLFVCLFVSLFIFIYYYF